MPGEDYVTVEGVWKSYGSVAVLKGIDLAVGAGRIHALVGGNGAGKSTLMRILAGGAAADRGSVRIGGAALHPASVALGHRLGVYLVPQEAQIFPNLSVRENVLIGLERSGGAAERALPDLLRGLRCHLDLDAPASTLEIANRQIVEILRGLLRRARVLILDEPTAALTPRETDALFAIMRGLAADGVALVFISHKLREVRAICDTFSVLRDGVLVLSGEVGATTDDAIVDAMTAGTLAGTAAARTHRAPPGDGVPALRVTGLTGEGFAAVDLAIARGEIVGLAGLIGAGRTEFAETLVGLRPAERGTVEVAGHALPRRSPRLCADHGLVYLSEDRADSGLFLAAPIGWNVTAGVLHRRPVLLDENREGADARAFIEAMNIRCTGSRQIVRRLSGGNQQKVLIAKCLAARPRVLVVDEPTRGVDVSARRDIYRLLVDEAANGTAILVISSDFDEIELLADRVLVMGRGAILGELAGSAISVPAIGRLAFAAGPN